MSRYRVFYIRHYGCSGPKKKPDGTVVASYRKKRIIKDVEADSESAAVASINSLPENPGDPYNRVWGVAPAADHTKIAQLDGLFSAEEVSLFSDSELEACKR